jgi:hypothetical protein
VKQKKTVVLIKKYCSMKKNKSVIKNSLSTTVDFKELFGEARLALIDSNGYTVVEFLQELKLKLKVRRYRVTIVLKTTEDTAFSVDQSGVYWFALVDSTHKVITSFKDIELSCLDRPVIKSGMKIKIKIKIK